MSQIHPQTCDKHYLGTWFPNHPQSKTAAGGNSFLQKIRAKSLKSVVMQQLVMKKPPGVK